MGFNNNSLNQLNKLKRLINSLEKEISFLELYKSRVPRHYNEKVNRQREKLLQVYNQLNKNPSGQLFKNAVEISEKMTFIEMKRNKDINNLNKEIKNLKKQKKKINRERRKIEG